MILRLKKNSTIVDFDHAILQRESSKGSMLASVNQHIAIFCFLVDRCANCHKEAKCVAGKCKCKPGFIGNGYQCEKGKDVRRTLGVNYFSKNFSS